MESTPQLPTPLDLEARAARIADPANALKVKHDAALELREMIDSVREAEAARVCPQLITVLIEALRSVDISFRKDSLEYQYRRVLIEIVNRVPNLEATRPHVPNLIELLLHIMRNDGEENAVTAVKCIIDIVRTHKGLKDELLLEFIRVFQELLKNVPSLMTEYLSEDSQPVDSNVLLPSMRSFKVLAEAPIAIVLFTQAYKPLMLQVMNELLSQSVDVIALEAPAQKKAREDYEAMGNLWVGASPAIKNQQIYSDCLTAQIKMISFVAYLMKSQQELFRQSQRGEELATYCVRLLQDCPTHLSSGRRELMVVLRHLTSSMYRRAFLPHLEKLFSEKILLGPAVVNPETLKSSWPVAYSAIADLVTQSRTDLTVPQAHLVINFFAKLLNNPTSTLNVSTLASKMIFSMAELVLTKDTPDGGCAAINFMLQVCSDKLAALVLMAEEVNERLERQKQEDSTPDVTFIEKDRPVATAPYLTDNPEDVMKEIRFLFRGLLHGFRVCLQAFKKCNAPAPDGEVMIPFFEHSVRCMGYLDQRDQREEKEAMEWLATILIDMNPHVFQELWTKHLEFYFNAVVKRPTILHVAQLLISQEATSPAMMSIILRYLTSKLPELGEYDDPAAVTTIRFYKLTFGAVSVFPDSNEPILAQHLGRLIMDSFPLAAKASHPTYYYHLMRALFRAIGSGGGRYELLYKEVLPLLPEMLESLNRQLVAADSQTHDLLVELCLTVPLRLTHLLPHLHYLMRPLVSALQGGPELVSQGLRTLELCIDNLVGDFLDPIIKPVLRELMEALHNHLRPLPGNHHHAHTTIRILGKLGGRNRRLLDESPSLDYHQYSEPAKLSVSFSGRVEQIRIGHVAHLSAQLIQRANVPSKEHAYSFLEHTLSILLNEGLHGRDRENIFVSSVEGLFDAVHVSEIQERAQEYLQTLSRHIFTLEVRKAHSKEPSLRRFPSHMFGLYLDALPHALVRSDSQIKRSEEVVKALIYDLVPIAHKNDLNMNDLMPTLHQIANRFTALCFDESWARKSAGCLGIMIMTSIPEIGDKWTNAREIDIVRTLLHVLKDLPHDPPRNVTDIIGILTHVLKITNVPEMIAENAPPLLQPKISYLVGIFFNELSSAHPVVRQAARSCIELLSELSGKSIVELLTPHRDRVLTSIYVKPLRALPHPIIIGQIEAVRYCVSLNPPLPELTEELLRLLHETLALADMDDAQLIGRNILRQTSMEAIQLRVACIKLLTASMPLTDFFSKQPQTRQRLTSVYFKSLYSPVSELKDVAHAGLKSVLEHQNRIPRDLLQSGLRPILMNLADAKRLSVAGLEGLARLLTLLTNYFKVEIGSKLLDHFRTIADPQMLQTSSRIPLSDNESITKLVRLVNIFHLLPPAANIFLNDLVNSVVQTEAQLHSASESPFSEPLGKFLDRYPSEAAELLLSNMSLSRNVRTFRNVLQSKKAPLLQRELASRPWDIANICFRSVDQNLVIPGLLLCKDLCELQPGWTVECDVIIDALLKLWRVEQPIERQTTLRPVDNIKKHKLMLDFFMTALKESSRIDLLFEIIVVYGRNLTLDLSELNRFLYTHVALNEDITFKRNILSRFLTWFDDETQPWSRKSDFLHYVITPTVLVHSSRPSEEALLDKNFIDRFHDRIWRRMTDNTAFVDTDDAFRVEVLYFTTVLVHHYPTLLPDAKKDIIKCTWTLITSDDTVVKQTAYLLAARFFENFESPPKFLFSAWTGLLKPPHSEGRSLVKQSLDIISEVLQKRMPNDPNWPRTTRRLLAEEGHGLQQVVIIYQLICRHQSLFFPCRALFIPHMVNSLPKLGLHLSASQDTKALSLDIVSTIFNWEQTAASATGAQSHWRTPLAFRETLVSFLVRMATLPQDGTAKNTIVSRSLSLLKEILGSSGWNDVSFKLDFFRKALDQSEINQTTMPHAVASARVLHVVCMDKPDSWYQQNAKILTILIQKGLTTEDVTLHESLHPILDRLLRLYPLPKEDEETHSEMSEFHSSVYNIVSEGLKNMTYLRGTLQILKSVIQVVPERIDQFHVLLQKVVTKLAKEHLNATPQGAENEAIVRLLISIFEICQESGQKNPTFPLELRKFLLVNLSLLAEKSSSPVLCQYLLDTGRDWALHKRDLYPTMKEKAQFLHKLITLEGRSEPLFKQFLELIYDIYVEPSLRRSELTAKLEDAFLIGCRARDAQLREKFVDLLDSSIPRSLNSRLTYILGVQNWNALGDYNWICLALDLLLSSIEMDEPLAPSLSIHFEQTGSRLAQTIASSKIRDIVKPLRRLLFYSPQTAQDTWVSVFSAIWTTLSRKEQGDITHHVVVLLSREYHNRQSEIRPNVIQALLEGIYACVPPMGLPPHLLKYLAKTFGAWHVSLELLQNAVDQVRDDDGTVRDSVYNALTEVYAELAEDDMFYGLWRRRSLHLETNVALTYEQNGMWQEAQIAYENAQLKAKNGIIPFSESEYCLWEDHWIMATEKLQQWEVLYELARADNNNDLMLQSAWRIKDWSEKEQRDQIEAQIQSMVDVATPRRRIYEAFLALVKVPGAVERNADFTRILEDAMQLSLRKWIALPRHMSSCHIPLLQHFQQFVELQEAVQIFGSLSSTTPQNLEKKSSDLKLVLQAWRDRLPNLHDDINVWSDLVAWRQNVFSAINKHYLPLIQQGQGSTQGSSSNTFGYRGFHEIAWIINRFAHVARKHDLLDVAQASLTRIYELPNIEISEAFLKLREEARCRLQVPDKLHDGLNLINNTNLLYFSNPQKAEFYTLKGMFYSALGDAKEAENAFCQAVNMDMALPKAWAEWARFNDKVFQENPTELSHAAQAVSCYLQAAGLYKNTKSRPLLTRVLWLLSVDDEANTVGRAFDEFKGDPALWYWITLIPQLCLSLTYREARHARHVLLALAKNHPQALFFPLRTTKEELAMIKKMNQEVLMRAAQAAQAMPQNGQAADGTTPMRVDGADGARAPVPLAPMPASGLQQPMNGATANGSNRQDWEYVEEVVSILKTAYPLLTLTLETMVDQFSTKFKATPEEEIYRFTFMLLQDGVQNYSTRVNNPNDDGALPEQITRNVQRLAIHLAGPARKDYEDDFVNSKPPLMEYIQRLQHWRDRYEKFLDSRPRSQHLDLLSHWLVEFQYQKIDEVEVPGQYLELVDSNSQFSRIKQFGPKFELCRGQGYCYRRFVIHGHDGTRHPFAVQQPAARWCRREERVMQLFRTFNHALTRRKESRKRNLHFHLPAAVSLSPYVRLVSNDPSYVSLQDVYDQHCDEVGITREDPIIMAGEKCKSVIRELPTIPARHEFINLKKAVVDEVMAKLMPETVLSRYMMRTMDGPAELWRMRKAFTLQLASVSFMTYVVSVTSRQPARFHISRTTGQIYMSEVLPGVSSTVPIFASNESVPFRFTPNLQNFVTPIGTEALLVPGIVAIARALTKPEFELDQHLCLFARDEVLTWLQTKGKRQITIDLSFRQRVNENIDGLVKKAELMACKHERSQDPKDADKPVQIMQTVTNLVGMATNSLKLAMMSDLYSPWF